VLPLPENGVKPVVFFAAVDCRTMSDAAEKNHGVSTF